MKNEDRFSNRVRDYIRYRPGYPWEAIVLLQEHCGIGEGSIVADVGSGTGIFSELLLKSGCTVYGVEPNDAMGHAARELLARYPGFHPVAGRGEATGLPDASVEHVTCAQAFHWFDRDRARTEFQRILRTGGYVAILWNERRTEVSDFARDYEALLNRYGTDYAEVDHRNVGREGIAAFFGPNGFQEFTLDNEQILDFDGLKGRILSCSYVPAEGQPGHEQLLDAIRALWEKHGGGGFVTVEYDTLLYLGRLS